MSSTTTPPGSAPSPGPETGFPRNPATTSVPVLPAVALRWSPFRFDAETEVAGDDLKALLEAARWAPSSYGEEPWRFIVARRGDPQREAMEETLMPGNAYARRASVLVATLAKATYTRNGKVNRVAIHDTGLATANLLAEATNRGLITHPMGGFDKEALRTAFRIPEDFAPVVIVAVGRHDPSLDDEIMTGKEERPRRRRSLEDTVFGAEFGVPLEL